MMMDILEKIQEHQRMMIFYAAAGESNYIDWIFNAGTVAVIGSLFNKEISANVAYCLRDGNF